MIAFVNKFACSIIATLCCFDRVIFKGHLPFGGDAHLNGFVDNVLRMRRKDFIPLLEKCSQRLVEHAQALCAKSALNLRASADNSTLKENLHAPCSMLHAPCSLPKKPGPFAETWPLRENPDVFAHRRPNNVAPSRHFQRIDIQTLNPEPRTLPPNFP